MKEHTPGVHIHHSVKFGPLGWIDRAVWLVNTKYKRISSILNYDEYGPLVMLFHTVVVFSLGPDF